MELGVHQPLMQFGEEVLSLQRLEAAVDAARGLWVRGCLGQRPSHLSDRLLGRPATLAVEVTYTELNAAYVDELPALRLGSGGDGGRV